MKRDHFWQGRSLDELTSEEHESLCDGCGRCCLVKLEDEENGEVHYTRLACPHLDLETCRCRSYTERQQVEPECTVVDADSLEWLPATCAYRRIARGEALPPWHPLVSGDPQTVHAAGISVRSFAVPADCVPEAEFEDHVIDLE